MELLWSVELGDGIIDCAVAPNCQKIVAGDVNGSVFLLDYSGNVTAEYRHDLPVWGIDIDSNGKIIAIGLAAKQSSRGALIIRRLDSAGESTVLDHRIGSPVWDVLITKDSSRVFATTWEDGLVWYDLQSALVNSMAFDHPLFGLSIGAGSELNEDRLFITASNEGLYQTSVSTPTERKLISRSAQACYNSLYVSQMNAVLYGSATNILSLAILFPLKDQHIATLMRSVCSLGFMNDMIFCGDLDGNFNICPVKTPASPVYYQHFEEALWHIAVDDAASLIFLACGDGKLYCYRVAGEIASNIHLFRDRLKMDSAVFRDVRVFISYASEDLETAKMIYALLRGAGCRPWLDRIDLLPGQDWKLEIESAIKSCDYCIVCLSRRSVAKRGFVQHEMKRALEILGEMPEGQIFLMPIRIDDCEVPSSISHRQWVDIFAEEGSYKLLLAIYLQQLKRRHSS